MWAFMLFIIAFWQLFVKYGYESRNQAFTITVLLILINEKKLDLDKDLVIQFDTLDVEKDITNPTIRECREISTYGVETSIDLQQLKKIKELILNVQRETIRLLGE